MNRPDRAILFITRKWPPAVGGMETYCVRLVERLQTRRDIRLIFLPGRPGGAGPPPWAILLFGFSTFVRVLASKPGGIVHVADIASWPLAWAARIRSAETAIVLSAHGTDLSYASRRGWRARLYRIYVRLGARLLGKVHVIANSEWIAGLARDHGFRQVSVVRMGTDFAPPEKRPEPNGALLFAGRIAAGKGLSFLVREVLPLLSDPPELRVAGSVWDKQEATCLASPGTQELGVLPPEQLTREYAAAIAVLIPSTLSEGFGLVAAEAAASGGVVLAAAHSGLAEAVLPETGYLLPPGNAEAWAAQISQVCSWSRTDRERFVSRSSAAACDAYNWDRTVDETEQIYRSLLAH